MSVKPGQSDDALALMDVQPPSPAAMLQAAIEKGADVESLEKLVGLYERMENRRAASEFTAAMLEFQKGCPPISRNRKASFLTRGGGNFNYDYADLPHICRIVNPLLHPLGLSYKWDSSVSDDGGRLKVTCTLSHVAGHSLTAAFEAPIDKGTGTSGAQDYAKVQTYGQRQSLVQVLGIFTADEDTDAAPGVTITADQAATLDQLIEESRTNVARFLKTYGVEKLADLPAPNYAGAVASLNAKIAAQR